MLWQGMIKMKNILMCWFMEGSIRLSRRFREFRNFIDIENDLLWSDFLTL